MPMLKTQLPPDQDEHVGVRWLRPSILDRLSRDPDRPVSVGAALTSDEFKESLRRHLEWIFRARCQPNHRELAATHPLLASSAMNFGIPPFRDDTAMSLKPRELTEEFKLAITRFEPRIRSTTVRIRIPEDALQVQRAEGGCVILLIIEAEALGSTEPLLFRARVNVATGDCRIGDERHDD